MEVLGSTGPVEDTGSRYTPKRNQREEQALWEQMNEECPGTERKRGEGAGRAPGRPTRAHTRSVVSAPDTPLCQGGFRVGTVTWECDSLAQRPNRLHRMVWQRDVWGRGRPLTFRSTVTG